MIPLLCIYTSYWAICSSVQHAFRGFWTFSMSTWCAALNRCLCWTLSWNPTCTTYVLYSPLAVPYTHAGGVHPFNYSPWHNLILGLHERGRLNNEWTNSSIFPLPSVVSNAKDINRLEHPEFPVCDEAGDLGFSGFYSVSLCYQFRLLKPSMLIAAYVRLVEPAA